MKKKILLVSVPSEQSSFEKNKGCSKAPKAIAEKIKAKIETIENAKQKIENSKKQNEKIEFIEIPIKENNIEETDELIYKNSKKIFEKIKTNSKKRFSKNNSSFFPVFLGGDHSISYSTFKAFSKTFKNKNSALIVFDAHPDCVQFFKPLSHEDWIRGVIEEKLVRKENVLLLGVRKIHSMERKYLKKNKISVIKAVEIEKNLKKSIIELENFLLKQKNVYLSIDIDVFDPSIAPGTGYLEKNGLKEKRFFSLFEKILNSEKLKAMDLVEVNPLKDKNEKTVKLARKIFEKSIKRNGFAELMKLEGILKGGPKFVRDRIDRCFD